MLMKLLSTSLLYQSVITYQALHICNDLYQALFCRLANLLEHTQRNITMTLYDYVYNGLITGVLTVFVVYRGKITSTAPDTRGKNEINSAIFLCTGQIVDFYACLCEHSEFGPNVISFSPPDPLLRFSTHSYTQWPTPSATLRKGADSFPLLTTSSQLDQI